MSFTDEQIKSLSAPLSSANVKHREQGGRKLSYVEGWQAIVEANRIFGFDGWTRETTELKCVSEKERMIGKTNPQPGWGVSYSAQVRVTVFAGDSLVTREGCGTGHGIDRDLGQAHESALKEAETDAMKRALMTFGNQFGLALYDKEQTNVADEPNAKDTLIADVKRHVEKATDPAALATWWNSEEQKSARRFVGMEGQEALSLKEIVMARIDVLKKNGALKPPLTIMSAG